MPAYQSSGAAPVEFPRDMLPLLRCSRDAGPLMVEEICGGSLEPLDNCTVLEIGCGDGTAWPGYWHPALPNAALIVGRTPRSARVPLDPLFACGISHLTVATGQRGRRQDTGRRPTINAGVR
jgi:hypothetical protein